MVRKLIYIIGSAIIGIIVTLTVMLTLVATDVISVESDTLVFTSESVEASYSGTPVTAEEFTLSAGTLKFGHTASASFTGSRTEVGSSDNSFSVTILDKNGKDVTSSYQLECRPGKITVTKRPLELTADSAMRQFDGKPLTGSGYTVTKGSLAGGHTVSAQFSGTQTLAGEARNIISAKILDSSGADVTDNYAITAVDGVLRVLPRTLHLRSLSVEGYYNGTLYSSADVIIDDGEIPQGLIMTPSFTEGLINKGQVDNRFSVAIKDMNGKDMLTNFDITYTFGKITVLPARLTFSTGSDSKLYDGSELVAHSYTKVSGELVSGQTLSVTYTGTQTLAGSSANTAVFTVTDADGNDTTDNYDISVVHGTLTVVKSGLAFTSEGQTKIYDGIPLSKPGVTLSLGELPEGYTFDYTMVHESVTDACSVDNDFVLVIKTPDGEDVTDSFEVTKIMGKLTVVPITLAVSTAGATVYYSDTELKLNEYKLENPDALLDGHTFHPTFSDSARITNAGKVENLISSYKVLAADGETDVSMNYEVDFVIGDLVVLPIALTIRTDSASKTFDGTPLTAPGWELVSISRPLEHHNLSVSVSGIRTDVGSSDNIIAEVLILTDDGENVTFNYDIITQLGELVVIAGDGSDSGAGGSGAGAGGVDASGGLGGGGGEQSDEIMLELYSETSKSRLLRFMSYGDYNGKGWDSAVTYDKLIDGKYSYNYLSAIAMKNAGLLSTRIDVISYVDGQYYIPYYADSDELDYKIQTNDTVNDIIGNSEYSLYTFNYSGYGEGLYDMLGDYADLELEYRSFVHENYLAVDSETLAFLNTLIEEQGFDSDGDDIINKVAQYVRTCAAYNLDYDTALDEEDNAVIAFLSEYKEGVCRHYASAGVLIYRALGIPARYTIGFSGKTQSGEWTEVSGKQAHAWVEVYIDGIGWLSVDVTGSVPDGGSGSNPENNSNKMLNVRPINVYQEYDGITTLYPINQVSGLTELTDRGYTYDVVISGSRKSPGITRSRIEELIIYDPYGEDVTELFEDRLNISKTGIIQVYLNELEITSGSSQKTYDGISLTNSSVICEGKLSAGHTVTTLTANGSLTQAGKIPNSVNIIVTDESGNDVTECYKLNKHLGVLEVKPREITVMANSATKEYDGTPLTDSGYTIIGELAEGDVIDIVITGEQKAVGRSANVLSSVKITNSSAKAVNSCYVINTVDGVLSVTPPTAQTE